QAEPQPVFIGENHSESSECETLHRFLHRVIVLSEIMRDTQESKRVKRYVRVGECLYRAHDNTYYFKGQLRGKEFTRSLRTTDRALAQRRLTDFRQEQERLDPNAGKVTLGALVELYRASLRSQNLKPRTWEDKERMLNRIRDDWPGGRFTSLQEI